MTNLVGTVDELVEKLISEFKTRSPVDDVCEYEPGAYYQLTQATYRDQLLKLNPGKVKVFHMRVRMLEPSSVPSGPVLEQIGTWSCDQGPPDRELVLEAVDVELW